MKALAVGLLGLLLGAAVGATGLYFNPLTRPDDDSPFAASDDTERLRYSTAGPEVLAFTHGAPLEQLEIHPASVPTLWESALAKTALTVLVATDEAGAPAALASRLSKLSPLTNPVTKGVVLADGWLVTVPGSGTYVIESTSNVWPLLRDTIVDVGLLRRSWTDRRDYRVTVGPALSRAAVVTGVSGIYREATGVAVDTLRLDGFGRLAELSEPIDGALEIRLRRAEAGVAAEASLNVARESP